LPKKSSVPPNLTVTEEVYKLQQSPDPTYYEAFGYLHLGLLRPPIHFDQLTVRKRLVNWLTIVIRAHQWVLCQVC